jgi:hypothetical protein
MSGIEGEVARIRDILDKPTLRLLDRKYAPLALAVFNALFGGDQERVKADRLHSQVDAYLGELRAVGEDLGAAASGRAQCVLWMNHKWLFRSVGEDGEEEYSLTSHTLEALKLTNSLAKDRALISESRIATILDTVRAWATEANPDRQARIDRLDEQIAVLTAQRDELASGAEMAVMDEDRMLDGYANLTDLISQLPSDFKRVEESVSDMHRQIINDFRSEVRNVGEVLDEYLARTDKLMGATPEGRAFEGAFELLRDDALLLGLRTDLQTIVEHPFAAVLATTEQREFLGTVAVIRKGIRDVLDRRMKLTTTLREHIVNHDALRDRELDDLLRRVGKSLGTWMETAPRRAAVPVDLTPDELDISYLKANFYDPASDVAPPALEDTSAGAPAPLDLEQIRKQGGPLLQEMRNAVVESYAAGTALSAGAMFNTQPDHLRRPVEILGLLQIFAQAGSAKPRIGTETFHTIRPDGTTREFLAPLLELTAEDVAAIAAYDERGSDEHQP